MRTTRQFAALGSWLLAVAVSLSPIADSARASGRHPSRRAKSGGAAVRSVPDPEQTEAVTRWLRRAAIPLSGVTAGNGFEDLKPLRKVLENVRVVGLGEATHGTREFYQVKHRLIEFLVRDMGFTVLALEAQYQKCLAINDYVLDGDATADPVALVRENLPGIYQTEEVLALVAWVRAYNRTVPPEQRVRFHGFDVQTPHRAADAVVAYLQRVDPPLAASARSLVKETAPADFRKYWIAYGERPVRQKARLRARLLQLVGTMAINRARYVRLSSDADYEAALQAARILVQSDEVRSVPDARKQTVDDCRDRNMAETVASILQRERPGTKIVLWAHNFHVWTQPADGSDTADAAVSAEYRRQHLMFPSMGRFLREAYGDAYYALGFAFAEGSFQAVATEADDASMEPLEFTLGPPPEGSLGWHWSRALSGPSVVDLRAETGDRSADAWLAAPQRVRFAGADFSRNWTEVEYSVPVIPRRHFDGLVFIPRTSRARPL